MAALTDERDTMRKGHDQWKLHRPVAAGVKIWMGALVATNAAGYLIPAIEATGITVLGRAQNTVDNKNGVNGAVHCEVWSRCRFNYVNDPGDLLDQSHIGKLCYAADDQTVSASDNGGARSPAGYFQGFDQGTSSVWVEVQPHSLV